MTDAAHAAEPGAPAPTGASATVATSDEQRARIASSLTDDNAEDVVQIDLRNKTAIGDFMIICSGRSSRHVSAMAEKLATRLKQEMNISARIEGKETGDWVLIDTGDVVTHVFRPEVREFYQLEKLWQPAEQQVKPA